jgi:predicted PurR-regulated permease PerM
MRAVTSFMRHPVTKLREATRQLVVPLVLAITTVVEKVDDISEWSKTLATREMPPPPEWVDKVPLVGSRVGDEWRKLAATPSDELVARATPHVRKAVRWFAGQAGGLALMFLHFLLTVVVTAILYASGEAAARGVQRFARRLAGDRGHDSVVLAGQAIRAVALGVVVTAILQSAAAGIGLAVAGVPYALVLTAIIFILCIAQLGPFFVLAPAVGWLF